ncbi:MAG: DUF930 domain-containing protein [Neorhizobium sp.]|nr:DUF930 domain-containing protein [Neorhizobium sp.]
MALHAIVVGLFFLKMPDQAPQVPKEETVQVELVPPPDETPKPPEPKPEPKPEIKPEAKPPEPKPEQKPPEQKAEPPPKPPEPKPEPPKPEPPKPEQAQKPPPPPPAPPPPEQQEKKPQEQQPPPPPQQADDQKRQESPIQTLRPVVEFADKDSGPRKVLDGSSSTDGSSDDAKDDKQSDGAQADKPADKPADQSADTPDGGTLSDAAARQMAAAEESADKSAEAPRGEADGSGDKDGLPSKDIADKAASTTKGTAPGEPMDHLPGVRLPDEVKVPEVDQAGAVLPKHGGGGAETDAEQAELVPALRKGSPDGKAEGGQAAGGKPAGGGMAKAKTLYSEKDSGDPVARTAMGNLPRETRASELCVTELKAQILHASPPYRPELLPSPRMPQGTVLEVRQGAFRANSRWYNLSFRCEIDQNATKVLSFAFDIGDAVPRGDWQKRGFPVF